MQIEIVQIILVPHYGYGFFNNGNAVLLATGLRHHLIALIA